MSRLNISIAVIVLTAALSAVDMPLQRVAAVMAVETAVDTVGVTARISAAAASQWWAFRPRPFRGWAPFRQIGEPPLIWGIRF
jgi:hypothetical protein